MADINPEEILGLYRIDNSPPPRLTSAECEVVRSHLGQAGMKMIAGSWGRPGDTTQFLSGGERTLLAPDTILGPYFLEDQYIPEAIGGWGVKFEKPGQNQI